MKSSIGFSALSPLFLLLAAGWGCSEMPVYNLANTFSIEIRETSGNQTKIKLDFLWVVDDTSSMCEEQKALGESFSFFLGRLREYLNVDIHMAVVTTDVIAKKGRGKFATFKTNFPTPGEFYGQACAEKKVFKCAAHTNCEKKYGDGWKCHPPSQGMEYLTNKNGSVNSYCQFYCNKDDDICWDTFCQDEEVCTQECLLESCVGQPLLDNCPDGLGDILTNDDIDYFACNATVGAISSNMETGLSAAWLALDPNGPNGEQSARFLRDDAYLVIIFISDEDDCSIDEEFFSPSFSCSKDSDCPGLSKCVTTELDGESKQLCQGAIKEDYYNMCGMLGEYKGWAHYNCAYDTGCKDCSTDEDCEDGWYCASGKKCRPQLYSFTPYASFQEPYGTPLYALSPVHKFYSRLRSLKADPAKVLVAAITGDGLVQASDSDSLISDRCLGKDANYPSEKAVGYCKDYLTIKEDVPSKCKNDPTLPERCDENIVLVSRCNTCSINPAECEGETEILAQCKASKTLVEDCNAISDKMEICNAHLSVKRSCVRQCYYESKGDKTNPILRKSTYICSSELGQADYGNRYVRLAKMFGPNGLVANICDEAGFGHTLTEMAELIVKRVTKICLPRPVKTGELITVTKTFINDEGKSETVRLKEGAIPEGDYRIEYPTQDCCFADKTGECTGTLKAVTFNEVLDPDWLIELKYEAEVTF